MKVSLLVLIVFLFSACAKQNTTPFDDVIKLEANEITLWVDQDTLLKINSIHEEIKLINTNNIIAECKLLDNNKIHIIGRKRGRTILSVYDDLGNESELIINVYYLQGFWEENFIDNKYSFFEVDCTDKLN